MHCLEMSIAKRYVTEQQNTPSFSLQTDGSCEVVFHHFINFELFDKAVITTTVQLPFNDCCKNDHVMKPDDCCR